MSEQLIIEAWNARRRKLLRLAIKSRGPDSDPDILAALRYLLSWG